MGEEVQCELCGFELEDPKHFLLDCPYLEQEREKIFLLQRPRIENRNLIIGQLLFGQELYESKLYKLWTKRKNLLKEKLTKLYVKQVVKELLKRMNSSYKVF